MSEAKVFLEIPLRVEDGPDHHLAGDINRDEGEGGERCLKKYMCIKVKHIKVTFLSIFHPELYY